MLSPGQKFKKALKEDKPLQIVGVMNAYVAIMAENMGFKAIYLSGAGVANASFGLPDLGLTNLSDIAVDVERITSASNLPLLVDIDTGGINCLTVKRAIQTIEKKGAAGIHIEDQPAEKRCGHREGKKVVSKEIMVQRIQAAVDARDDASFAIMARTDALAVEGLDKTMDRIVAYVEAGADMIFLEAATSLEQFSAVKRVLQIPLLANLTEFGVTPLWGLDELCQHGVDMALYPLSASRAMNLAALLLFEGIKHQGTQKHLLEMMQTREELYGFLNYEFYEEQLQ